MRARALVGVALVSVCVLVGSACSSIVDLPDLDCDAIPWDATAVVNGPIVTITLDDGPGSAWQSVRVLAEVDYVVYDINPSYLAGPTRIELEYAGAGDFVVEGTLADRHAETVCPVRQRFRYETRDGDVIVEPVGD